jgi:hypothetical protein
MRARARGSPKGCGVYRAIVASGILAPRAERSCASKKGGRAACSASVSDGVGSPRRAYSASGDICRTDDPLVRRRRRRRRHPALC